MLQNYFAEAGGITVDALAHLYIRSTSNRILAERVMDPAIANYFLRCMSVADLKLDI